MKGLIRSEGQGKRQCTHSEVKGRFRDLCGASEGQKKAYLWQLREAPAVILWWMHSSSQKWSSCLCHSNCWSVMMMRLLNKRWCARSHQMRYCFQLTKNSAGVLILREFKTQDRKHSVLYTRSLGSELTKELRASLKKEPRPYLFKESNSTRPYTHRLQCSILLNSNVRFWWAFRLQCSMLVSIQTPMFDVGEHLDSNVRFWWTFRLQCSMLVSI